MSLKQKIFWIAFGTSSFLLSACISTIFFYLLEQQEQAYRERYRSIANTIGMAFVEMEASAERLMRTSAELISERDRQVGLLDENSLKKLAVKTGVTHVFIIQSDGKFIRSTNENPKLIPNFFSFCSKNRGLISGKMSYAITPIIPPTPEPSPYKFLSIPNFNRTRIIHVGYKAQFLGKTLIDLVRSDKNVLNVSLFTPDGISLGEYGEFPNEYKRAVNLIPQNPDGAISVLGNRMEFYTIVKTPHENCCQCDTLKLSRAGSYYYVLRATISRESLSRQEAFLMKALGISLLASLFLGWLLARFLSGRVTRRLSQLSSRVISLGTSDERDLIDIIGTDEAATLAKSINRFLAGMWKAQDKLIGIERKIATAEIASQVSHDIRSPLSALNMIVGTLQGLPEDKRHIIRSATQRINDIANQLLQKSKNPNDKVTSADFVKQSHATMLVSVLDSVISEKRVQYREKMDVQIRGDLDQGYGLFASIDASELARTLSNLINNSVEALNGPGLITVQLKSDHEFALITIQDNGKGIPAEVLTKLGERGITHGKEGSQSGSGLGVSHAQKAVEDAGGQFRIESTLGAGTKVTLAFPKAKAPWWFVEKLSIVPNQTIVSLDDDQSIHQIWNGRIKSATPPKAQIRHLSFSSTASLEDWYRSHQKENTLFLVDYEILGQSSNGLDVIERLGIAKQSVLVTSRFDEAHVRDRAKPLGVKILPKGLAPFVPISLQSPREKFAAVVIDDDILIHDMWKMAAKAAGHKVACFKHPEEFFAQAQAIHLASPLFIDVSLGEGLRGENVAEQAAVLGFTEIALATGHAAHTIQSPACVKRVVGKEPIF